MHGKKCTGATMKYATSVYAVQKAITRFFCKAGSMESGGTNALRFRQMPSQLISLDDILIDGHTKASWKFGTKRKMLFTDSRTLVGGALLLSLFVLAWSVVLTVTTYKNDDYGPYRTSGYVLSASSFVLAVLLAYIAIRASVVVLNVDRKEF